MSTVNNLHRHLLSELNSLKGEPLVEGILNVTPYESDFSNWEVWISGPTGTLYEGGKFKLKVTFPDDYPSKPPRIVFQTEILHLNIFSSGEICLDVLSGTKWNVRFDVAVALSAVRQLLAEPNPLSPANIGLAMLWGKDREQYQNCVKRLVEAQANGDHLFTAKEVLSMFLEETTANGSVTVDPFTSPQLVLQTQPSLWEHRHQENRGWISPSEHFRTDFRGLLLSLPSPSAYGFQDLDISEREMKLTGILIGPDQSRFEKVRLPFSIQFSQDYFRELPEVEFTSHHLSHPNVQEDGKMDPRLFSSWNQSGTTNRLQDLLVCLQSLFCHHNKDFIANERAPRPGLPTTFAKLRLQHEAKVFHTVAPTTLSAAPDSCSLLLWNAVIFGSLHDESTFELILDIPENYPFESPQILSISGNQHNLKIDNNRLVGFKHFWTCSMDILGLLTDIQKFLSPDG